MEKALELDPLYTTALRMLYTHIIFSRPSDEPNQRLDQERFRPLRKTDIGAMRGWATELMFENRLDEAEEQLRQVAQLSKPDKPSAHDHWVQAAIDLRRGHPDAERRLAAAVAEGPVTLREIDTANLYMVVGNPRMAAVHLDRLFRADPACATLIEQLPAMDRLRTHPELQAVISKYRAR